MGYGEMYHKLGLSYTLENTTVSKIPPFHSIVAYMKELHHRNSHSLMFFKRLTMMDLLLCYLSCLHLGTESRRATPCYGTDHWCRIDLVSQAGPFSGAGVFFLTVLLIGFFPQIRFDTCQNGIWDIALLCWQKPRKKASFVRYNNGLLLFWSPVFIFTNLKSQ